MRYMDNWAITNMSTDLIIEIIILGHNNLKNTFSFRGSENLTHLGSKKDVVQL